MVLVLFANTNFKMYLLRVLSLIQELRFNVSVSVSMSGSLAVGLGVGVGSYQPGVYVPLKALFLVFPGTEVIKHFSCSTQLSMKFQLLMNVETTKISGKFMFRSAMPVVYSADKCWHFTIYELDKFQPQLSRTWNKFYNLRAWFKTLADIFPIRLNDSFYLFVVHCRKQCC